MNEVRKWDRRMLDMAKLVASWSKDESTQVGAVLTDKKNRIIGLGYNGFPRNVTDVPMVREEKLRRTIHAELNAVLNANGSVEGATAYVTHHPCAKCAALLVQVGVVRVVCPPQDAAFAARWAEDMASAKAMFNEAGILVEEVA